MAWGEKPWEKDCEGIVGSDSNSLWTLRNVFKLSDVPSNIY